MSEKVKNCEEKDFDKRFYKVMYLGDLPEETYVSMANNTRIYRLPRRKILSFYLLIQTTSNYRQKPGAFKSYRTTRRRI